MDKRREHSWDPWTRPWRYKQSLHHQAAYPSAPHLFPSLHPWSHRELPRVGWEEKTPTQLQGMGVESHEDSRAWTPMLRMNLEQTISKYTGHGMGKMACCVSNWCNLNQCSGNWKEKVGIWWQGILKKRKVDGQLRMRPDCGNNCVPYEHFPKTPNWILSSPSPFQTLCIGSYCKLEAEKPKTTFPSHPCSSGFPLDLATVALFKIEGEKRSLSPDLGLNILSCNRNFRDVRVRKMAVDFFSATKSFENVGNLLIFSALSLTIPCE